MLGQVNPTPFDLYFPVFGIQVRVTPWFWLAGLLTGYPLLRDQHLDLLLIWIGCLFFSILIHEMGHAFAGRMFGWPSDVMLYHFGGVARFYHQVGYTTGRSVVVSFAGPWAGFLLYGIVLGVEYYVHRTPSLLNRQVLFAILQLKWINLYWGLVNLLPVLPLDGGQISHALFEQYRPRDGLLWCLRIGTAVGGIAAALFFLSDYRFAGLLFALLAIDNFQRLEQYRGGW
jgi:stage IV sporulation protein FB